MVEKMKVYWRTTVYIAIVTTLLLALQIAETLGWA